MIINSNLLKLNDFQIIGKENIFSQDSVLGENGAVEQAMLLAGNQEQTQTTDNGTKQAIVQYLAENSSKENNSKNSLPLNSEIYKDKSIVRKIADGISGIGKGIKFIGDFSKYTKLVKAGPIAAAIAAFINIFDFDGISKEEKGTKETFEGTDDTKKLETSIFHPWNTIKTGIKEGIKNLEAKGYKFWAGALKGVKHIGEGIATFADGFLFGDTIRGTYRAIKDMITGNMDKKDEAFKKEAEECKTTGDQVKLTILHPWNVAKMGINQGIEKLSGTKNIFGKVAKGLLVGIKYGGEAIASAVDATVGNLARTVVNKVTEYGKKAIDGVKYAASKVADFAKTAVSKVGDFAKNVGSKIGGFFKRLFS